MINRIFGWLFTLATLAVIVFVILNRGNYSSMCFNDNCEVEEVVAVEVNESEEPVMELPDAEDDAEAAAPAIDADTTIVQ
jgi:hypothetical protein